jgi:hypothetical protein
MHDFAHCNLWVALLQAGEAVRYLEFCVHSLGCQQQAIHNYLLSLYARLKPQKLMDYLGMQGQYYDRQYADTVKPLFIVFVGSLKKKQWVRENYRCGSHSWNRIRSGTIEIERWIPENELSGNNRYRFHSISVNRQIVWISCTNCEPSFTILLTDWAGIIPLVGRGPRVEKHCSKSLPFKLQFWCPSQSPCSVHSFHIAEPL